MEALSAPLSAPVVRPPTVGLRLASDARLSRLAASGSDGAMAAIFERHHQALHRYCHSILGNGHDAADALQNTMVKALRALPGETRQIALRPWLYRIAHNESISLLRARRPDRALDAAANVTDTAAAGAVESREQLRSLTEDLSELTERQRGALLMRELGGLEFTEVAEAMGTNPSAVKQSVYEARCALQAMQDGRAMDCETIRRTLSDGDRRMLRGMRMRGHLRACAGCCAFEAALHQRPAQLMAVIPPLPIAAAAAMLHGLLGGGSSGGSGGLVVGLAGGAKVTTGFSLGTKAAAVVAASTALAGGAAYVAPELRSAGLEPAAPRSEAVAVRNAWGSMPGGAGAVGRHDSAGASRYSVATRGADGPGKGKSSGSGMPGWVPGSATGTPAGTAGARPADAGKPAGTPGGKPSGTPGGRPSDTGKPARTPGGRPADSANRRRTPTPRDGASRAPGAAAGSSNRPSGTPGASAAGRR